MSLSMTRITADKDIVEYVYVSCLVTIGKLFEFENFGSHTVLFVKSKIRRYCLFLNWNLNSDLKIETIGVSEFFDLSSEQA